MLWARGGKARAGRALEGPLSLGHKGQSHTFVHGTPVWSEEYYYTLGKETPQFWGMRQRTETSHPNLPTPWSPLRSPSQSHPRNSGTETGVASATGPAQIWGPRISKV